jgi:hypothetical protein
MKITTNNHPREIVDAWELSPAERKEFDYIDWEKVEAGEESASFFRYKRQLYDLGEFDRTNTLSSASGLFGWDGFLSDSFFSAIVVKFVDDFERVIVGIAYSGEDS